MIELLITLIVGLFVAVAVSVAYFYRDPDREVPKIGDVLLSPADGTVISIRRYSDGEVPTINKDGRSYRLRELIQSKLLDSNGVVVSIHISVFDVHTVRSPISGKVVQILRIRGSLKFMQDPTFEYTNERVSIIVENTFLKLGLVIVGAPIASSIRTVVEPDDEVSVGQRVALIRLGSLVSLIIPDSAGMRVKVACGSRVIGGSTIIADRTSHGTGHHIRECFIYRKTSVLERFYLIFLAAYSMATKIMKFGKNPDNP
jgi:phosphatidylserine decarboxylase